MRRASALAASLLLPLAACDAPPRAAGREGNAVGRVPAESLAISVPGAGATADGVRVVYVPVYSHIYPSDTTQVVNLAATLSIRNTDPGNPITVHSVRYFDNDGRLVRTYLDRPRTLRPMASAAYVVDEDDTAGGVGANFLVEWAARGAVTEPLIEAVMISFSAQGISFTSRGQTLERR